MLTGAQSRAAKDGSDTGEIIDPSLKKPFYARGEATLCVSYEHKRLDVSIPPLPSPYLPGSEANVEVRVLNHVGKPVKNAEVFYQSL